VNPVTEAAFLDELEKIAKKKKERSQVGREFRDPRLYSNLRHMFKSKEERIRAHKQLPKSDDTVWGAMKAGFGNKIEKKEKTGAILGPVGGTGALRRAGGWLSSAAHPIEVAGLGVLAAPSVDNMIAKHRARKAGLVDEAGHPTEQGVESKRLIKERFHDAIEAGGLGALAIPSIGHRLHSGKWMGH
jgi:hypothetical protein